MTLPPVHEIRGRAALRSLMDNQLRFFETTYTPGRDVVRVLLGPPKIAPEVFITHSPDAAELLLSAKSYANFPKENRVYRQIRTLLGDGILTAWGEDWRRQKTLVQPIFTRARVEGYLEPILEEIDGLAQSLRSGTGPVDLGSEMTHFTLKVVCRVLFGTDLGDREAIVNAEFPRINKSMIERAMMMLPLPLGLPTAANRRASSSRSALYDLCDSVIAERRENPGTGDDLASLLVAARAGDDSFSDDEVRDQILIFLLAGHETTSTSLTFALHLLGRHPDVQARLRDEVNAVIGTGTPTAAQIMTEMPYTTAVMKEAMRLYPAAPITGRRSIEGTTVDGYDIPPGSDVAVCVWSIHHREDLWPDPYGFDPERFLGSKEIDRYAWLPFGAGPRACIGQHFSMLESIATVALLVRDFEFAAPPGSTDQVPVASGITLYPLEPVRSHVTPR